ncbi:hypothetical protein GPSY_0693 [Paraglaciecola psychrophila 170]|nr:hypothetical protein GPSY_0693 [Paraglaciecola psychrophila 170]
MRNDNYILSSYLSADKVTFIHLGDDATYDYKINNSRRSR